MFEGQIQGIDYPDNGESPVLQQLRWTDLIARLAATRDLRGELREGEGERATSFAGFRCGQVDGPEGESKRPGNHDVLSHGKFVRLSRARAANDAVSGDRENS